MTSRWILLGSLGVSCLLAAPAHAGGELISWSFDPAQNRLSFRTADGVRPRAQLVPNPARIVMDLPGTTVASAALRARDFNGAVRQVRVGQYDAETTRLVIELAPGYDIDPQQVQVRGATPTQWTVQLPAPRLAQGAATPSPAAIGSSEPAPPQILRSPGSPAAGIRQDAPAAGGPLRVTRSGILLQLPGATPERVAVTRSDDRRQIEIELGDTNWPASWTTRVQAVERYGVGAAEFLAPSNGRPARVRLHVNPEGPDWRAIPGRSGSVVLVPKGGMSAAASFASPSATIASPPADRRPDATATTPAPPVVPPPPRRSLRPGRPAVVPTAPPTAATAVATVNQLLVLDDARLIVRGDRALDVSAPIWDPRSSAYFVLVRNAVLSPNLQGPQLSGNGPIRQVRVLQQDSNTVRVAVTVAGGSRAGSISRAESGRVAALDLHSPQATRPWPRAIVPPANAQAVPSPPGVTPAPVPRSAPLIAVDPGHGGRDPGAIGIGGLREKDVVLDISRHLQRILSENGMRVLMTRSDDRFVSLDGRSTIANRANADLFVSVHANAINLRRPDINGVETFYYSSDGRPLAGSIQQSVLEKTGMRSRGVKRARFYVLRHTEMPAVLVEVGFVTGRDDAPKLRDPAFRRQMAEAIADGVLNYVRQNQR